MFNVRTDNTPRDGRLRLMISILLLAAVFISGCARKPDEAAEESATAKAASKDKQPPAPSAPKVKTPPATNPPGVSASPTTPSPAPSTSPKTASAAITPPVTVGNVETALQPYRGKVVLLDIWATWCGPCRVEIPGFVRLQEKYRDQGLEVIGVSIDPYTSGQGEAIVRPFMQQFGINYTIWMVNSPAVFGKYPPGQGIPTTYIIDRNGRTAKMYVGVRPESQFESDIKELL
jgi:thiol-disulfide isomerase/thioredoxin